jgi:hypothetical protein
MGFSSFCLLSEKQVAEHEDKSLTRVEMDGDHFQRVWGPQVPNPVTVGILLPRCKTL